MEKICNNGGITGKIPISPFKLFIIFTFFADVEEMLKSINLPIRFHNRIHPPHLRKSFSCFVMGRSVSRSGPGGPYEVRRGHCAPQSGTLDRDAPPSATAEATRLALQHNHYNKFYFKPFAI
ncbi:unnamed protein product [Pieris brassicae]|uniref:Uncharacterized protein n=1 Tax=Pieris brassicae TaxID=7116 RepID=A0A9P0XEH6_PIEBR|nr:unnamed protein product [Pieris brassicae]